MVSLNCVTPLVQTNRRRAVAMTRAKRHMVHFSYLLFCVARSFRDVHLVCHRRLIDSPTWGQILEEVDDMARGKCGSVLWGIRGLKSTNYRKDGAVRTGSLLLYTPITGIFDSCGRQQRNVYQTREMTFLPASAHQYRYFPGSDQKTMLVIRSQ